MEGEELIVEKLIDGENVEIAQVDAILALGDADMGEVASEFLRRFPMVTGK